MRHELLSIIHTAEPVETIPFTMDPAHPKLDDTDKAAMGTVDEPNKLQGYASAPDIVDEATRVVDHKAERRLCRRFDLRLLPILAVMCTSAVDCTRARF